VPEDVEDVVCVVPWEADSHLSVIGARALDERDEAMRRRARELAERAMGRREPWLAQVGPPPRDPVRRGRWLEAVSVVAAYRERWAITDGAHPLGRDGTAPTIEAARHRERVLAALRRARELSGHDRVPDRGAPVAPAPQAVSGVSARPAPRRPEL
jgi:hypothetical protein